jgi:hypothetical protein
VIALLYNHGYFPANHGAVPLGQNNQGGSVLVPVTYVTERTAMKTLLLIVAWCILLVLCWPLALLALVLFPFVWLISLPLRLVGITAAALFALLRAVLFLPARVLGHRPRPR